MSAQPQFLESVPEVSDLRLGISLAKLEAAGRFLESRQLTALLVEGVERAVRQSQSDWLDRVTGPDYALVGVSQFDVLLRSGLVNVHGIGSSPRVLKADVKRVIEDGTWSRALQGNKSKVQSPEPKTKN